MNQVSIGTQQPANLSRWSGKTKNTEREFLIYAATTSAAQERFRGVEREYGEEIDFATVKVDPRDAWQVEIVDERKAPGA